MTERTYVVGATYRSAYWGYTYKVLGFDGISVAVQCVEAGSNENLRTKSGDVWSHMTALDPRDELIAEPEADAAELRSLLSCARRFLGIPIPGNLAHSIDKALER